MYTMGSNELLCCEFFFINFEVQSQCVYIAVATRLCHDSVWRISEIHLQSTLIMKQMIDYILYVLKKDALKTIPFGGKTISLH